TSCSLSVPRHSVSSRSQITSLSGAPSVGGGRSSLFETASAAAAAGRDGRTSVVIGQGYRQQLAALPDRRNSRVAQQDREQRERCDDHDAEDHWSSYGKDRQAREDIAASQSARQPYFIW